MFRRRRRGEEAPTPADHDEELQALPDERADGPYDIAELGADARAGRVDLGGLLVRPAPGMKVQLQVDKRSGKAASVVLSADEAAVQLIAVAAPRSSGLWDQTRLQIAADARKRGGRAEEATGPFGPEMRLVVPVQAPDGKQVVQPSRISAVDGPRWMLRATFLGKATTDAAVFQQLVDVVRQTVVVRGDAPMAPGDVIVLTPPAGTPPPAQAQA